MQNKKITNSTRNQILNTGIIKKNNKVKIFIFNKNENK